MKTSKRKNTIGSVLANLAGKALLAVAACALVGAGTAQAAYVTIGDTDVLADTTGFGAVDYTYQISATEVTIAEFTASGAGDGDENYWNTGSYSVGTDAPAANVSLYEAMKYANHLTSGDVDIGYYSSNDGGSTYSPDALSHDEYAAANGLTYFVPTENEWYKAAYYTGNSGDLWSLYADDGTDTTAPPKTTDGSTGWNYSSALGNTWPVDKGTAEQNGTRNMMGNVWEWQEDTGGVFRGGDFASSVNFLESSSSLTDAPGLESAYVGFRVVAIPEPASGLFLVGGMGLIALLRRKLRR